MFVKTLMIVVYSRKAAVLFWQTLLAFSTDMSFTLSAVECRPRVLYEILLMNSAKNNICILMKQDLMNYLRFRQTKLLIYSLISLKHYLS